ncbi:MAG: hypothetical protein NTW10_14460 [Bacteroidetes bacterium]|nr:hypothetical protein [Bacteroidota bacterium]
MTLFKIFGVTISLAIFLAIPGFSQDTTKVKGEKKVKIVARVVDEKNGKTRVYDTTINLDRELKPGEKEKIMKEIQVKMKSNDDQMKRMEVELSATDLPDSGMLDSIQHTCKKFVMMQGCSGKGRSMRNCCSQGFNFESDFDMPEGCCNPGAGFEQFGNGCYPGMFAEDFQGMMNRGEGESLNDLLGDIPMDRVTSYSIKETKNGKKITIELKNDPLIEHRNKVIIIRSPEQGGRSGQGQPHQMQKKIIIKDDD